MSDITTTLRTSESVLQFEPEELAGYLLEHLADHPNDLHFNNLVTNSIRQHYRNDDRVNQAFMEAWS